MAFDHCGARTSHRNDQAPKPKGELLPDDAVKMKKNKKKTIFAAGLDNVGLIEAYASRVYLYRLEAYATLVVKALIILVAVLLQSGVWARRMPLKIVPDGRWLAVRRGCLA